MELLSATTTTTTVVPIAGVLILVLVLVLVLVLILVLVLVYAESLLTQRRRDPLNLRVVAYIHGSNLNKQARKQTTANRKGQGGTTCRTAGTDKTDKGARKTGTRKSSRVLLHNPRHVIKAPR